MSRDVLLSRLAAARGFAMRISNQLDETIEFFLLPDEDSKGHERTDLIDGVIEDAGRLSRVMEKVQELFEDYDPTTPAPEEADDEEEAQDDLPIDSKADPRR